MSTQILSGISDITTTGLVYDFKSNDNYNYNCFLTDQNVQNRTIIWDKGQIRNFAEQVLMVGVSALCQPLVAQPSAAQDGNKTLMTMIAARKKYSPEVKVRRGYFLRKEIFNATAEKFVNTVCQYNVQDCYYDDNNQPLPLESLAIYSVVNARDTRKALQHLSRKCLDAAFNPGSDAPPIVSWAKTALHRAAIKEYVTLDIDDASQTSAINEFLEEHKIPVAFTVVTRGGYHVLLRLADLDGNQKQDIFQQLSKKFSKSAVSAASRPSVTVDSDMMCPIPGTLQGGHRVTFYPGPPRIE